MRGRRKRKRFLSLLFLAPFPIVLSFDLGSAFARAAGSRKLQCPRHSTIPCTKLIIASALPPPPSNFRDALILFSKRGLSAGYPNKNSNNGKIESASLFPLPIMPSVLSFLFPSLPTRQRGLCGGDRSEAYYTIIH